MEKEGVITFESCGITLFVEWQENQWYNYSRCSKHMAGDKDKLIS